MEIIKKQYNKKTLSSIIVEVDKVNKDVITYG